MKKKRRDFLKILGTVAPFMVPPFNKLLAFSKRSVFVKAESATVVGFDQDFKTIHDRTWIGENFLAVPLEDWEINKGQLVFTGKEKRSRLHLLTYPVRKGAGEFRVQSSMGIKQGSTIQGSTGFAVGITDSTDENVKAACYHGQGVSVGVTAGRLLFIGDKKQVLPEVFNLASFTLTVNALSNAAGTRLALSAIDDQNISVSIEQDISSDLKGLIALETKVENKNNEEAFWWKDLHVSGTKLTVERANRFGPILWTMHTLSGGILKLSVQFPPLGRKDVQQVELDILMNGRWHKHAEQTIDPVSYTAIFRLTDWSGNKDLPYRVVYDRSNKEDVYEGKIRKEPLNGSLKFGGLTCQHWGGYPYTPLVNNLTRQNPDILYFSGDQLYEENGGYPIKRQPENKAILSYLGKWYMFGWVFRNLMRDRPTICTPDDHDFFQGNFWGEGGEGISLEEWEKVKDAHGGFVQTPHWLTAVILSQCGHLPDPFHKQPLNSGMKTWHTQLDYGRVSFAIVSDRLFKSGPEMVRKGTGRIDHITEPVKPDELASDKLSFLGARQMEFLNKWVEDWQHADMKVLLSQTIFSNVGTHHGDKKEFFPGDMDSGGWPKRQRDEVVKVIRKACAFHINGDQHLPFIVQYGVDEPRDGGWSFCTPAISTGYPRWGQPDLEQLPFFDRPAHTLPNTGCYRDVFGNENYVYAVGNPTDDFQKETNRYTRAQEKSSGFGLITFDTINRTIKMEAFRFLANLDVKSGNNQFPGWPLTIHQTDNDGRKATAYLPELLISKPRQLVKIIKETNQELVSVLRIQANRYQPKVHEAGVYTVVVGEGDSQKIIGGVLSSATKKNKTMRVNV